MKNDMNDNIDFGPDANVVHPADPAFDAWVGGMARSLNEPRQVPRLEVWDAIQAARQAHSDAQSGRIAGVTPLRRNHWRLLSVIAAALLVGVAIDRYGLRPADATRTANRPSPAAVAAAPAKPAESSDASAIYRLAASQTLTQAEALLTAFRADDASTQDRAATRQIGRWGRDILGSTRLLIDSPAGDDPQLRALLEDLELVLVQIVQLSGDPLDAADRARIDRALQDRDLLPRIRTEVPAGVSAGAAAE